MPNNTITPEQAPYHEIGISGVARFSAVSRVYEEFLRELQGPQGMRLYREALDNDPIIGAIFFAIQYLSRNVTFRIEAAQPKANIDSQRADGVAERVRGALFDDLDASWPDMLSEILSMAPFGWAFFETTFKKCLGQSQPDRMLPPPLNTMNGQGPEEPEFTPSRYEDGFIGWKSWGLRSQDTLFMWEWDANSRAVVLQQMAPPDYRVRRIPLAKGLLFRTQLSKQNPEGRSMLRNAMTSYLLKKNLQIVEAVGIERDLAGYPVITTVTPDSTKGIVPPDLWNTNDANMVTLYAQIQKLVKAVRRDEQEGMVLPWWLKFELLTSGGSRSFDTSAIISRYDRSMAMSVLADFIMLGHESVGSKALATVKSQLFTTALESILDSVTAVINRFAIPQLLKMNGIPQEYCPRLAHSDPEQVPIEALGTYISSLAKSGMPLFPNGELEEALLRAAKLPINGVSGPDQVAQPTGQKVLPGEEGMFGQPGMTGPNGEPNNTQEEVPSV
jgi:hypothetical protein